MAGFSATDAAFEGFRITRERPRAVLAWGLVYLLGVAVLLGLLFTILGADFLEMARMNEDPEPEEAAALLGRMLPALLLAVPLIVALSAVLMAAIYRAVLRPGDSARAYLRFGGDEVRLFLVSLILAVLWGIGLLLLLLAVIALYQVAAPLGVLAGFAAVGLAIWAGVRFSLAAPMTFAEGRIEILGSWRATKGRFWPLLGMYVLAAVMAILVSILATVISSALLAVFGGGIAALAQADNPDFSEFGPGLALGFILYLLVQLVAAVLQLVIAGAPPAAAYRDIVGRGRETAEVFS